MNKSSSETYMVIGALVVDIHQRIQSEKTLLFTKYRKETTIEKYSQTTFFQLCCLIYINNQNTYDSKNFSV